MVGALRVVAVGLAVVGLAALILWIGWFRNPYSDVFRLDAAAVLRTPPSGLLIQDVALVDPDAGAVVEDVDVIVRGDVVEAVLHGGQAPVAPGTVRIDGRGRFVLPGLIDAHAHLSNGGGIAPDQPWSSRVALEQLALYGVTTILCPGGRQCSDRDVIALEADRRAGRIVSPVLLSTGDMLTVPGSHPISTVRRLPPDTPAEELAGTGVVPVTLESDLEGFARARRDLGLHGIKIVIESGPEPWYPKPRMSVELARRITAIARRYDLPVYAHVSSLDELEDAVRAGVTGVMHSVHDQPVPDALVAEMARRGIWSVPTLSIYSQIEYLRDPARLDDAFLRAGVQRRALRSLENPIFRLLMSRGLPEDPWRLAETAYSNLVRMHAAGVPIAAGSDAAGLPFSFPGFSLHRDLEMMVDAGLSPAEALRAATLGGAGMLGLSGRAGRIAPGTRADLLVLDANPLDDIRNTRRLHAVVLGGRCLPPVTIAPDPGPCVPSR